MTKIYHSCQVANWFLKRAQKDKKDMSVMLLMKLAYFAHGWRLEMKNKPLFSGKIEAWRYGPVIVDIYNAFRNQGANVTKPAKTNNDEIIEDEDIDLLEQIWQVYGKLSSHQLTGLTHVSDGPWDITMKTGNSYGLIPDELIRQHHILKRIKSDKLANEEINT